MNLSTQTLSIFRTVVLGGLLAVFGAAAAPADAALCGDKLQKERVPCACGDIVVTDTRLRAGDPVVSQRCDRDGLIVDARPGESGISLDFGGHSIVGSGIGYGVLVLDGGKNGARIRGGRGARVVGFDIGVKARGTTTVREIADLKAEANRRDGVDVRMIRGTAARLVAENNGRDGLSVALREGRVQNLRAEGSGRKDYRLTGAAKRALPAEVKVTSEPVKPGVKLSGAQSPGVSAAGEGR